MNQADFKRAQELSKSLRGLGYAPKKVEKKKKPVGLNFLDSLAGFPKRQPIKFDYKALEIKDGGDGKDAPPVSHETLLGIIEPLVKQHFASIDKTEQLEITPEIVKKIVQMMHDLPEVDKLEVSKGIRNAQSFIYGGTKYNISEMMHGGSSSTATGTQVYSEIVSGSGTAWTLAHTPDAGTIRLYANGQRLTVTVDYSIVGTAITTLTSWTTGTILADYTYA